MNCRYGNHLIVLLCKSLTIRASAAHFFCSAFA